MSHDDTHTHYLPPQPSTTPAPDPNLGSDDGPFDPGNTPPLVFVFIAVGFLTFGLIVMAIYKRCRPTPDDDPLHHRPSVPVRRPSAQKPKLWDVWIAPDGQQKRPSVNDWESLVVSHPFFSLSDRSLIRRQPLSAALVYPYSPPVRVPAQYVQGHVSRPVSWEKPEHRLFFRRPPADTSIHVAVIITMPNQAQTPARTHAENEVHMGVTNVKWR